MLASFLGSPVTRVPFAVRRMTPVILASVGLGGCAIGRNGLPSLSIPGLDRTTDALWIMSRSCPSFCLRIAGSSSPWICPLNAVRAFATGRLAHYKIPRYVLVVDEFPMTVTGKIRKVEMRERSVDLLDLSAAAAVRNA